MGAGASVENRAEIETAAQALSGLLKAQPPAVREACLAQVKASLSKSQNKAASIAVLFATSLAAKAERLREEEHAASKKAGELASAKSKMASALAKLKQVERAPPVPPASLRLTPSSSPRSRTGPPTP